MENITTGDIGAKVDNVMKEEEAMKLLLSDWLNVTFNKVENNQEKLRLSLFLMSLLDVFLSNTENDINKEIFSKIKDSQGYKTCSSNLEIPDEAVKKIWTDLKMMYDILSKNK